MTRAVCDVGQPRRMETCGAEEPYEGNLHVRFCGGISRVIVDPTRTMGLLEVAATAGAMPLSPGATVGMSIGTDIAKPYPAAIGTVRLGAEVRRDVHLARTATRGDLAGWRATGRLGCVRVSLLTGGTRGRAGEARKRLRVAGALARWHARLGWLVW